MTGRELDIIPSTSNHAFLTVEAHTCNYLDAHTRTHTHAHSLTLTVLN